MGRVNANDLGARLVEFATDRTERLLAGPFRNWSLPQVWGGHPVGADVAADLAFTISHLRGAGVSEIGAAPIDGALQIILRQVDGPNTHSFFSYRVAETLLPYGPFDENHLLAGWTTAEKQNLRDACDSTSFIGLLGEGLPRNYHAVLARCELGRSRLGLIDGDGEHLGALVDGTRSMLAENPHGFLDDSLTRFGRYDIYTADVHLFCEPLADRLGPTWRHGMQTALDLVRRTASPDGSAIGWGRSTGALSVCLTAELTALAIEQAMTDEPGAWLALAGAAADSLDGWFDDDGIITAHVDRSTYFYRGPERRLQMSVDCLGKIAEAGRRLQAVEGVEAIDLDEALPHRDDWEPFDSANAGAWIVRTPQIAFTLPVTGSTVNDYLPAPHQPGRLEVAVQDPLPGGTPAVWKGDKLFVGGGLPDSIEHGDHTLTWSRAGFPAAAKFEEDGKDDLAGARTARWTVDGRSLVVREQWQFGETPDLIAWQWAEADDAPVSMTVTSDTAHRIDVVSTAGLKEWRSFWGTLPRLHQVSFEHEATVDATITLTTKLRVGSTAYGHHYDRAIYREIRDDVDERPSPWQPVGGSTPEAAASLDLFHLHWPEWVAFDDIEAHEAIIGRLRAEGVPIVWTQHNLTPHSKEPDRYESIYARWAAAADGVIHHTAWGRDRVQSTYEFNPAAEHRLIPHGHWGRDADRIAHLTRADAEAQLGLEPCAMRFGIVGAPRAEKLTQAFLDGFSRATRADAQLVVWSLGDETVPDDPRIIGHRYVGTDRKTYDVRLRACDVLVLPFTDGMLATGTAGDGIAHGMAVMSSDWGFLTETFGDAAIPCPLDPSDIGDAVDAITTADVERSAAAVAALRPAFDWGPIATATLELFDALPRPPRRR